MKKTIKLLFVIVLIAILNFVILANAVQAVENGGQIKIYTKGEFKRIIKYNGIVVKTAHAVYEEKGQEYPVYCLNKDVHGVGEYIATYDVTMQGKITDLQLWRVIINGYPYKTPEQLGTADEGEAYTATKQAIYCYIYNRGTENYEGIGEAGNRVINAMNTILENAKNTTESFDNQNVEIKQATKWQVDEIENKYISKEYQVNSNINITKFIISLENQPNGTKITNLDNIQKNDFNSNENFKILIPITSLEDTGEFKIKIQAQMETKPIFFGKAPSADLQDYALTAFSYEDIDTETLDKYERNETKVVIEKQDSETEQLLAGAKFEVLNENKKVIRVVETDSKGKIILNQIIPGIYYIREIKAPEGYEVDSKLQKIEIKMNETKNIKIQNKKIIIEEPPIEENMPVEEKLPIEEPSMVEVPKLPVTGM